MLRKAIVVARHDLIVLHPLSSTRFRTDGRTIFLEIAEQEKDPMLFDLFNKQYAFAKIMERSLKDVEFDGAVPNRWWISSKRSGILVDPEFSFGQPIEYESSIPTTVLANAAKAEGSVARAARAWDVSPKLIERAVRFENAIQLKAA